MSWPGESGLGMDTGTTANIVIGGCIGEALVPVFIGLAMEVSQAIYRIYTVEAG